MGLWNKPVIASHRIASTAITKRSRIALQRIAPRLALQHMRFSNDSLSTRISAAETFLCHGGRSSSRRKLQTRDLVCKLVRRFAILETGEREEEETRRPTPRETRLLARMQLCVHHALYARSRNALTLGC